MSLEARNIGFFYSRDARILHDVSLTLEQGHIVGLMGPSGRGKSTLGRIMAGHLSPMAGAVTLDGRSFPRTGFRPVQFLHQTPVFAMNPRWRISRILSEAGKPEPELVEALGIRERWLDRYPHELSGGELQRIALARAIHDRTRYIIADEITSMLDPIAQSRIWRVLADILRQRSVGILAISHDAPLLSRIADRIVCL